MTNNQELQQTIKIISQLGEDLAKKRSFLERTNQISSIEWQLTDIDKIKSLIILKEIANGADLSVKEKEQTLSAIKSLLKNVDTVEEIEYKLLDIRKKLNSEILQNTVNEINDYKSTIENASHQLQKGINKLDNLSEVLGTITVGVSLFTAIASASSGNFLGLIKIINRLV